MDAFLNLFVIGFSKVLDGRTRTLSISLGLVYIHIHIEILFFPILEILLANISHICVVNFVFLCEIKEGSVLNLGIFWF
jgi:hypothetical protein